MDAFEESVLEKYGFFEIVFHNLFDIDFFLL